ncbi:MAG: transcription antitermination factor NusB [Rickettsiaceae bacterium]|nr:transcription antitermination factor NusB [Rickettsiaceae bacterium]
MTIINTKTMARIASVQALYQYAINGETQNPESLISSINSYYKDSNMWEDLGEESEKSKFKINVGLLTNIIKLAIEHKDSIDEIISQNLGDEWQFKNLHLTLIALLRAGICEILYFPETPRKVVINEFTNIASDMLKEGEISFVNSLLDKVSMEREAILKQSL